MLTHDQYRFVLQARTGIANPPEHLTESYFIFFTTVLFIVFSMCFLKYRAEKTAGRLAAVDRELESIGERDPLPAVRQEEEDRKEEGEDRDSTRRDAKKPEMLQKQEQGKTEERQLRKLLTRMYKPKRHKILGRKRATETKVTVEMEE